MRRGEGREGVRMEEGREVSSKSFEGNAKGEGTKRNEPRKQPEPPKLGSYPDRRGRRRADERRERARKR